MSWLWSLITGSPSAGWFRVLTKSGNDAGFGYECEVCRGLWAHSLRTGQKIEHCGRIEPVPASVKGLPIRRLGSAGLPANLIPCFETTEAEERPEVLEKFAEVQWI